MYLLVLLLPFLNVLLTCLVGRFLGIYTIRLVFLNFFLSLVISVLIFFEVGFFNVPTYLSVSNWFHLSVLHVDWIFLFDSVTSVMLLLIIFVSFLVHVYSVEYMSQDPHLIRFIGYLSIFTFFMLVLVTSGNFLQMFLGWEGVGLSSYLLINFWYTRIQANKSAMKAIFINRFGDFGIYFSLLSIFYFFKSLDFSIVFLLSHYLEGLKFYFLGLDWNSLDLVCFFLFVGAIGKSAQIGLHTWLPDAMEGPTPVSALIHAATMVTAGVFVLIRCSPILEYSPISLFLVALFGSVTSLLAGLLGLVQNDMKKIIAYSTCSQLGYMFLVCGMSDYSTALFHLFNHGFFKALLFLGAGSVIHSLMDEQDLRKMGGLVKLLPITYCIILVGSLCLIGFPFLSGFYSKELILEIALVKISISGYFFYFVGTFSAFVTAFYSMRLIFYVFFNAPVSNFRVMFFLHESTSYIFYVIAILGFLSIFIGYVIKEVFIGVGSGFWGWGIFQSLDRLVLVDAEFLMFYYKLIPLIFSLAGFFVGFVFYKFLYFSFVSVFFSFYWLVGFFYLVFIRKWFFDLFYNNFFVYNCLKLSYKLTFKLVDRGIVEFFGPLGIVQYISSISSSVVKFQTGYLYNYIFIGIVGLVTLLFIIWYESYSFSVNIVSLFFIFIVFNFL